MRTAVLSFKQAKLAIFKDSESSTIQHSNYNEPYIRVCGVIIGSEKKNIFVFV